MSDSRPTSSRTVVFVLGMHRAGTSVTTAILNALGVSLSEDLMPPTQFNAMGYFESIAISKIHDDLLAALGSSWNTSELFVPFPQNWWKSPQVVPFKQRLIAQVTSELERVPGTWGFKDPRTARLLPLWKDIVAELGLDPRYVLVVRDPQDVAKSLHTRERVHPVVSELLWLEHYAGVIAQLGNNLHAIVDYARWFTNPMDQAEYLIRGLGFEMPARSELEAVLNRTVSSDLRHHQTAIAAYALPYSRELYAALSQRDAAGMEMLTQLFEVNKTFGGKMALLAQQQTTAQLTQGKQITLDELNRRLQERIDVSEDEVAAFVASANLQLRQLARGAVAQTTIRKALASCGALAAEQSYSDQSTITAIQRLATICDIEEPYIETLKRLGIRAAEQGLSNQAMPLLQEAVSRGFSAGQRKDARSRKAMRYAHDREIAAALEKLATFFTPPSTKPASSEPIRLAILCSAVQDEDGPSVITLKRTQQFRDLGYDVVVVSTEMASSANSVMSQKLKGLGVPLVTVPGGTWEERVRWMIAYFTDNPVHTACYLTSAVDQLAILAACIGLAPVQSWDTRALEPQAGKFDIVIQGVSAEQEIKTRWPGKSKFVGLSVAMADEIDAASAFDRAELGVPGHAVLLGTFGRMEKCVTVPYLEALTHVLANEPAAWLILAGRDAFGALQTMQQHFSAHGVWNRVKYLGPRQQDGPRLLKTIDVYCDTYPWPGGQTLLDAMQAGVPIVAMRRSNDRDLDPTGEGSTTALADVLLSGVVDLADAGNARAYASIARKYIADPALRSDAGRRVREKAVNECNMRESTRRYSELIRERLSALAGLV